MRTKLSFLAKYLMSFSEYWLGEFCSNTCYFHQSSLFHHCTPGWKVNCSTNPFHSRLLLSHPPDCFLESWLYLGFFMLIVFLF